MSSIQSSYGANIAFIEELYEKYRANPDAVSPSWREFFHDYQPQFEEEEEPLTRPPATLSPRDGERADDARAETKSSLAPRSGERVGEAGVRGALQVVQPNAVPLRGAAGKIAQNMEASLSVPTATSVRNIPVKALEENRRVLNHHLALTGQAKTSFTHIVAWAIVQAVKHFPRMNAAFAANDGQPMRVDHADVNLGLAIDVERKDGSRSLVVPNVKRAQTLDFAQ